MGVILVLVLAWTWAGKGGAFKRIEFKITKADGHLLPVWGEISQPIIPSPVVLLFSDRDAKSARVKAWMRQFAELGFAAIYVECNSTEPRSFEEAMVPVLDYLRRQPWVKENASAWICFGKTASYAVSFGARNGRNQPRLMVCIQPESGLDSRLPAGESTPAPLLCPLVLIGGEADRAEIDRMAERLRHRKISVLAKTIPVPTPQWETELPVIIRAVGDYCLEQLGCANYAAAFRRASLNAAEMDRFNQAMFRAGKNRPALWRVVERLAEPERRTAMMAIGGMVDYDLTHITSGHLESLVRQAWRARRTYPWCREVPLEIFERYVATSRASMEPLEDWRITPRLKEAVKYCRTTAEASTAVCDWMWARARFQSSSFESSPRQILARGGDSCIGLVTLYTCLGRSVGIPVRPSAMSWPTLARWHGIGHSVTEVWDVQKQQWHSYDSSAGDRTYEEEWMLIQPKATIYAPRVETSDWNAIAEERWEDLTNTVGLFFPSGQAQVQVLDQGRPAPHQRVQVETWINGVTTSVGAAWTDSEGVARFVLGQSGKHPYRMLIDRQGETDWQWLGVQSNQTYSVVLSLENHKTFVVANSPPALEFPQWQPPPRIKKHHHRL